MLDGPQQAAAWDFMMDRITEADFVAAVGRDPRSDPGCVRSLLADAARRQDGDALEVAFWLMIRFGVLGRQDVPLLGELLVADWHIRHEDIARLLQEFADPASVLALRRCAELNLPYVIDDGRALSRKCMWALSDIRTPEAVAALDELTRSPTAHVRELALYHRAKVRDGEPPSRMSRRHRNR